MRISDCSSDVCSSDLNLVNDCGEQRLVADQAGQNRIILPAGSHIGAEQLTQHADLGAADRKRLAHHEGKEDGKSVVEGKSVSVREELGGRRSIKKNKTMNNDHNKTN